MAPIPHAAALLGQNFVKLSRSRDFPSWKRNFKLIAESNGVWGIYQGTEDILKKPVLKDYLPEAPQAKRETASQNDESKFYESPPASPGYNYMISIFNVHFAEWKANDKSVRLARALLQAAVEPWIWPDDVENDPHGAWTLIEVENEMSTESRLFAARLDIGCMKSKDFKTLRDYIIKFDQLYWDVKEAGGNYTRSELIEHIIQGLPGSCRELAHRWVSYYRAQPENALYRNFCEELLKYGCE